MDRHTFNGKRKVGSTDLSDFTDFQGIGRDPLYRRYSNIKGLIDKSIDPRYADFLAIPNYDDQSGMINWYINDWEETPVRFVDLPASEKVRYEAIKEATLEHYRSKLNDLSGEDLRIMAGVLRYIGDDFIYCADSKVYAIAWGMAPDKDRHVAMGELIHESPLPPEPEIVATPLPAPSVIPVAPPPPPPPPDPAPPVAHISDKKKKPWWFWLLMLIPLALLALLLIWLLGGFKSCNRDVVNGIAPLPVIVNAEGDSIENNGFVTPIILEDGKLPNEPIITAPVLREGGEMPAIIREPGLPSVLGDRLILFMEDSDASLDDFANAFKQAYPSYEVIGYDRYVNSLTVQVPENEREAFKNEVEQRLSGFRFLVFDESIYELNAGSVGAASARGWHLDAVKAQQGWQITKGSADVKVAVVDDGIDRNHSMFSNRIQSPYNVFTRNNQMSKGMGHGTMVAGLAVGSIDNVGQGAAGIAPDCSLIPVQVADNGIIPLSAIVSGVMYSVHQGADVVNVSIGPQLRGLNVLPVEDQVNVSRTQFLNTAKMWSRVCAVAGSKNTIIVFAAGNDDILSSIPPENRAANCIVVGAVDERLYPTEFTNYGFCTDISAPGTGIYSSYPVDSYTSMDGTSFSAPIVTGAVALMRSLKGDLTVKQAKDVLYRTGKDVYGFMPPMVQIPAVLEGVKSGDFSRGPERQFIPVPTGAVGPDGDSFESWTVPVNGTLPGGITIVDQNGVLVPVDGTVVGPGGTVIPGVDPAPADGIITDGGTIPGTIPNDPAQPVTPVEDYSFIRNRIKKLKQEIRDLESQLPENSR